MTYRAIDVAIQGSVCRVRFERNDADNTIDKHLVSECLEVVERCERDMTVLILEGSREVFCQGADFRGMYQQAQQQSLDEHRPDLLYDLWTRLATGSFVSIAHVRGRVNAGGVGFVAASDVVVSDASAQFSLSEMLFGLMPACVLPFLIRRVGFQRAHYMTLLTLPVDAQQALSWGLVDACGEDSAEVLRKHLLRLRRLSKGSIARYKAYANQLKPSIQDRRELAISQNRAVFSDPEVIQNVYRYVESGRFPWEA